MRSGIFFTRWSRRGILMHWIRISRARMRSRTGLRPARTLTSRNLRPGNLPGRVCNHRAGLQGTYILRPNQSGGGSHVANAAFMVSASARGHGIGRAMAEHCLSEARRLGFRAMQFNYVISTNTAAIRLWQDLGFEIVGTLAECFPSSRKRIYRCLRDVPLALEK